MSCTWSYRDLTLGIFPYPWQIIKVLNNWVLVPNTSIVWNTTLGLHAGFRGSLIATTLHCLRSHFHWACFLITNNYDFILRDEQSEKSWHRLYRQPTIKTRHSSTTPIAEPQVSCESIAAIWRHFPTKGMERMPSGKLRHFAVNCSPRAARPFHTPASCQISGNDLCRVLVGYE